MRGVVLGLSITSTWGNGHATTYRALLKEFAALGHHVTFLERDVPWYRNAREFETVPYCQIALYDSLSELQEQYSGLIREADFVIVGSYVPEGIAVGEWVMSQAAGLKAFYDIDTPITLSSLRDNTCEYLSARLVSGYNLYLSFTGGHALTYLQQQLHSPAARALYCSVDASLYYPETADQQWDLGYLGTYAADRQAALGELLIGVAGVSSERKFVVAGPQYPEAISWPRNVQRISHLPAAEHRMFYNSQAFTLNLTRRDMIQTGYSPSVRLFEAAACGVPIITDNWPGLDSFFAASEEILPVTSGSEVLACLRLPAEERQRIARNARLRTLREHTAKVRAKQLQDYLVEASERVSHLKTRSRVTVL